VRRGTPVVSVVIKAYNHAAYVAESIHSVLQQSFQDFEIVVTDDGSTDGTPEIIERFTDERIHLERFERNRGAAAAMNATVARARGEFVAILNSDDFALPWRLETQVRFLRNHRSVGAVFSLPLEVGEDGRPVDGFGALWAVPFAQRRPSRAQWLRHFFWHGNTLCAPSAMVRRAAFEAIGPDDPRLMLLHDLDRWIRLLERYEIHVLAERLTAFRIRDGKRNASAATSATHVRDNFEAFQLFKRYREFAPRFLREIFAEDLERYGIDAGASNGVLLAELALHGEKAWHPLFALDSLYGAAGDEAALQRLRELSGSVNAFRIPIAAEPS
jgi:glycosyltransferase involved in cell wall biosynthesis